MKINTTRVETFSDGVIAIAITIMALGLKLPGADDDTTKEIKAHVISVIPYFVIYAFSFLMIGIFWTNHHHLFHMLSSADEPLIWQNLFFLFCISLIPFATALMGANPLLPITTAFYGFIMLLSTLSVAIMRYYTLRKKLLHKDKQRELTVNIYRVSVRAKIKSYIGAAAYLLSVILAFVNVYLTFVCFIIPPIIFFVPDGVDDEKLAEKIAEKNG